MAAVQKLPIDSTIANLPVTELQAIAGSWGLPTADVEQNTFAGWLITLRMLLDGRHTAITAEDAIELHDAVLAPYDSTTLETIDRETVIIDLANHFDVWITNNPPLSGRR